MAEIVNILMISRKKFNKLINLELEHCLFQVGKILNYFGRRWQDFYKEGGLNEEGKTGKYHKEVMYFHILFSSLQVMYNLDDFIKLCFEKEYKTFLKTGF